MVGVWRCTQTISHESPDIQRMQPLPVCSTSPLCILWALIIHVLTSLQCMMWAVIR